MIFLFLIKITLVGLFFGTFGTTLGGIIGLFIKSKSNKLLSFILSIASGLMLAVVCFDLIPEALSIGNYESTILLHNPLFFFLQEQQHSLLVIS